MHRPRKLRLSAGLVVLALPVAAGCSSASTASTTTKAPPTTVAASTTTTTTAGGPASLPATGSVDGFTLSVTSSPITGTVGHTSIVVTAVVKGAVKPATLEFQVSDRAAADVGKPATVQRVAITRAGTYPIPHPYSPTGPGSWASSVTYLPRQSGASQLTVSGLPPVAGAPSPFPQLVTVVTAS